MMEEDPWVQEGDLDAARTLVGSAPQGELFLYPGRAHLLAERGVPDYDPRAAAELTRLSPLLSPGDRYSPVIRPLRSIRSRPLDGITEAG